MGLTQVSTDGVKNDAITKAKIPANQIEASELADNAVDTNAIADQAVALSKLPHGDGSSDGKFLRANNGADPTFETVTGTTINNNADNRVITGSGTANTLNGESDFIVNSSNNIGIGNDASFPVYTHVNSRNFMLGTGSESTALQIHSANNLYGGIYFGDVADRTDANSYIGSIQYKHGDDYMDFRTNGSERMRILSGGGITFNGDTAAANALDDYEEGTWTPAVEGTYITSGTTTTYHVQTGTYTRIGRQVFINGYLQINAISYSTTNQVFEVTGLPFNGASSGGGTGGVTGSCVWQQLEWVGSAQSSYGTDNDVELAPTVSGYNKVRFRTASQDKYYIGEMLNNAVDGNSATFIFSFWYLA